MSTEQKIAELRLLAQRNAGHQFDHTLRACESPIEKLFVAEMLVSHWTHPSEIALFPMFDAAKGAGVAACGTFLCVSDCYAFAMLQASVEGAPYRLDLAFIEEGNRFPRYKIAVELDGHDFHEKTKEQVRRDKARDRWLTANGWRVVRFAGSEVYANPGACLDEVLSLTKKLHGVLE